MRHARSMRRALAPATERAWIGTRSRQFCDEPACYAAAERARRGYAAAERAPTRLRGGGARADEAALEQHLGDNLLKGAALNTVQLAEVLLERGLVGARSAAA